MTTSLVMQAVGAIAALAVLVPLLIVTLISRV